MNSYMLPAEGLLKLIYVLVHRHDMQGYVSAACLCRLHTEEREKTRARVMAAVEINRR